MSGAGIDRRRQGGLKRFPDLGSALHFRQSRTRVTLPHGQAGNMPFELQLFGRKPGGAIFHAKLTGQTASEMRQINAARSQAMP